MLFPESARPRLSAHGKSRVDYIDAKSILTKPSGFGGDFDYSLNPYSGCAFGCSYCYAAFFARTEALKTNWGDWVQVKDNAVELLRKRRRSGALRDRTLYMSTVTDPYQPVERELELTRAILAELLHHGPRLTLQTRSPLVTRDLDLLTQFEYVQVNMTVTTDDEDMRRLFEPTAPANPRRLEAITQVSAAGVRTAVTMTPLLPVRDPHAFAQALLATGAQRFVVQAFHAGQTRFASGTASHVRERAAELGWTQERYRQVTDVLRAVLPDVREGKDGFRPRWP